MVRRPEPLTLRGRKEGVEGRPREFDWNRKCHRAPTSKRPRRRDGKGQQFPVESPYVRRGVITLRLLSLVTTKRVESGPIWNSNWGTTKTLESDTKLWRHSVGTRTEIHLRKVLHKDNLKITGEL